MWRQLFSWVKRQGHTWRKTHELERVLDPRVDASDIVLELCLPIEEPLAP